jgi:translocation protein SEC63
MSSDYNYDENGQFFPFFILTITGLITVPVTYSLLKPSKQLENTAPRIPSDFKPEHADLIDGQRRKQKRRERKLKRGLSAIGGWVIMAFMVYLILVTQRTAPKVWDPHSILGISLTASEREVKRHFRKLSLYKHPDKVKLDPTKNQTIESVNEEWVDITKAFKALTDEEIRRNYLEYGHPDGKQGFSIGIALPKFIVAEGSGRYVLGLYGLVLGMLLPYLVGKWWYGQQRVTKEKVLVSSAGKLFKDYEEGVTAGGLLGLLSTGDEYKDIFKGDKSEAGLARLEQRILKAGDSTPYAAGLSAQDVKRFKQLDEGHRRKILGLLWAYIGRVELDEEALNDGKDDHLSRDYLP